MIAQDLRRVVRHDHRKHSNGHKRNDERFWSANASPHTYERSPDEQNCPEVRLCSVEPVAGRPLSPFSGNAVSNEVASPSTAATGRFAYDNLQAKGLLRRIAVADGS